jgi:hypothetical protein
MMAINGEFATLKVKKHYWISSNITRRQSRLQRQLDSKYEKYNFLIFDFTRNLGHNIMHASSTGSLSRKIENTGMSMHTMAIDNDRDNYKKPPHFKHV